MPIAFICFNSFRLRIIVYFVSFLVAFPACSLTVISLRDIEKPANSSFCSLPFNGKLSDARVRNIHSIMSSYCQKLFILNDPSFLILFICTSGVNFRKGMRCWRRSLLSQPLNQIVKSSKYHKSVINYPQVLTQVGHLFLQFFTNINLFIVLAD